jgi:hypothetical protein
VRYCPDTNPRASLLLHYLLSQAWIPEYQVRRLERAGIGILEHRVLDNIETGERLLDAAAAGSAEIFSLTAH